MCNEMYKCYAAIMNRFHFFETVNLNTNVVNKPNKDQGVAFLTNATTLLK